MKKTKFLSVLIYLIIILVIQSKVYSQPESEKNAKKVDLNPIETADAVKDIALAKIKINRNSIRPDWAPGINDEMLAVIEKYSSYRIPAINNANPDSVRKNPTLINAMLDLLKENKADLPEVKTDTATVKIKVKDGEIPLLIFTPKDAKGPFPVIMYYHGGGFVAGSPESYYFSAKSLSEFTGCLVVSVGYRLAPENKLPVAQLDAFEAYQWVQRNAGKIKGDPLKIAVAGENAGGNLALNVSLMAKSKGIKLPVHQTLIYPIAGYNFNTASYLKYKEAEPINKSIMQWNLSQSIKDSSSNKFLDTKNKDFKGLPTTTFIAAELDPLYTEGEELAKVLNKAGVRVYYRMFDGVTHDFFGLGAIIPTSMVAEMFAAKELKLAFGNKIKREK